MLRMISHSVTNFSLFCICQDFIIEEKKIEKIIKTYYEDERTSIKNKNINDILKYVAPRIYGEIDNYPISIRYFYQFFPSNDTLLNEIHNFLKNEYKDEKINKIISDIKELINEHYSSEGSIYNWDNNKLKISVRMKSEDESFDIDTINEIWINDKIKFLYNIQKNNDLKSEHGFICINVDLNKDVKIIGNIIPRQLPLPLEIESAVGKTTINGIRLDFEKSPLGLNYFYITKSLDGFNFALKSFFSIEKFENVPNVIFEYINNIINFFIEEVN